MREFVEPTKEEVAEVDLAMERLAEALVPLAAQVADLRPEAMIAWLRASQPCIKFEHILAAIEFCDGLGYSIDELVGMNSPEIEARVLGLAATANDQVLAALWSLVGAMRVKAERADRVAPTVDQRRPSSKPPAEIDPVRIAARAVLDSYDASMRSEDADDGDVKNMERRMEDLRRAFES